MHVLVSREDWAFLKRDAREQHRLLEYRPTAVAVVTQGTDGAARVLLMESRKSGDWTFPQGKVEKGEHPAFAASRELREEIGIPFQNMESLAGPILVGNSRSRRGRGEFTRGKRYYFFHIACSESPDINLQWSEVAGYHWFGLSGAPLFLRFLVQPARKKQLMMQALKHLHC